MNLDDIETRAVALRERLRACDCCPRRCGVDRTVGVGWCKVGERAHVHASFPHFGEERVLVGRGGSGTVFLGECNLRCLFCQNQDVSRGDYGEEVDDEALARIMIDLQAAGCVNVNVVTPSHVAPQLAAAIARARRLGLKVPVVWNSSAYELVGTLAAMEGLVDIYMPDLKFASTGAAARYLDAPDYPEVARAAIREMHRQVGDLAIGPDGVARRGLLVRHLVMPGGVAEGAEAMRFLARLSPDTYVNVMDQYRPFGGAATRPEIARRPTPAEVAGVLAAARAAGLWRFE